VLVGISPGPCGIQYEPTPAALRRALLLSILADLLDASSQSRRPLAIARKGRGHTPFHRSRQPNPKRHPATHANRIYNRPNRPSGRRGGAVRPADGAAAQTHVSRPWRRAPRLLEGLQRPSMDHMVHMRPAMSLELLYVCLSASVVLIHHLRR